jgi:hypothetical protein
MRSRFSYWFAPASNPSSGSGQDFGGNARAQPETVSPALWNLLRMLRSCGMAVAGIIEGRGVCRFFEPKSVCWTIESGENAFRSFRHHLPVVFAQGVFQGLRGSSSSTLDRVPVPLWTPPRAASLQSRKKNFPGGVSEFKNLADMEEAKQDAKAREARARQGARSVLPCVLCPQL